MILPSTYLYSMILLVLSMLCWGSWANTYKLAGPKWRFELFYYDFAVGVLLATLIAGFTFGSLGWDGFSFLDDIRNAGKRQDLFAFLGGCVFNLANMLLVAAISLAGMAVAFPVCIGLALVIGTAWSYFLNPVGNPALLTGGCVCVLAAIAINSVAFKSHSTARLLNLAQQGKTKSTKKSFNPKGLIIAVTGGVLMGSFYPLVEMARVSEIGLGPYGVAFVFAGGVLFSTFVYNLFFMNLPVQGNPVDFTEYFKGTGKGHLLGILGGMLWAAGAVTNFVAARAEGAAQVGPAVSYAMGQGATLISALWGLMYWKEFAGADSRVKTLLTTMLVLFVVGLALVSVAPLYNAR
ncbi:MAG TPA: hypothetical protein VNH18_34775 [Bryobacteraceae bacterium]|nr:hypothetical protein [Bryobacteraceae bacterium]